MVGLPVLHDDDDDHDPWAARPAPPPESHDEPGSECEYEYDYHRDDGEAARVGGGREQRELLHRRALHTRKGV